MACRIFFVALLLSLASCSDTASTGGGLADSVGDASVDGGIVIADVSQGDAGQGADVGGDLAGEADTVIEPDATSEPDVTCEPDTATDAVLEPDAATEPDVITDVAPEPDAATEPDAVLDVAPEPDAAPEPSLLTALITVPGSGEIVEEGTTVAFKGLVSDSVYDAEDLMVTWMLDNTEVLAQSAPGLGGWTEVEHTFLVPGNHVVSLTVSNPDGDEKSADVSLGVCSFGAVEAFDQPLTGGDWTVYGDAYWDAGGWLEMTGNASGKKGAIFNTAEMINPGDVEIHFSIWTGGGINSGADGFAMSVVNVPDVPALENFINTAANGGCLGYGVSGACGPMALDAFHVEFDTWNNQGDVNYDPTAQNHVAVMLDGDASNHVLWVAQPLEDSQWHDVSIETMGQQIIVTFDGVELINDTVADFQFHGGFIGFTGVTGWATNFHRFDNLQIIQECVVP